MTVSARKITAFAKLVAGLADTPNLGSTALLKQWFDSSPEELRVAFNGLIDDLIATAAGASGTEQIGSAPISGVAGATAYAQLVDLKAQLNAAVIGTIPDGTLDYLKLNTATKDLITEYGMARQAGINGNFDIPQRGTSFTNPLNNQYTLDRWKAFFAANGATFPNVTHSQQILISGDIPGAYFFYRIATDGAGSGYVASTGYQTTQYIENGTRYLCGNGKKVTVSFWARSSIANKRIGIYLFQTYGTGGAPSANEVINGTNFTLTSTWTKYTFTFTTNTLVGKTFGSNKDDYLGLFFMEVWGSVDQAIVGSATAETFVGAGNIDIAQVQINAGSTALPFQPKSYTEEERLCQRYGKVFTDSTNSFAPIGNGLAISTTVARILIKLPTTMRISPTLVATPSDFSLDDGVASVVLTGISIQVNQNSSDTLVLNCTVGAGLTQYRPYFLLSNTTNKRLFLDSEL